jgi:DNA-binding SARP family transcriptional activator
MLAIRLLGTPQIILDQRPLAVSRRKSRALLYYLAVQTEPVSRDHLLTFFWPDHERPAAQRVLRTTLYTLRQAVGAALQAEDGTLSLTPETEVDARTFETQLAQANLETDQLRATLELYRGDFLANFTLPDPPEFDDWVAVERERYRRLAIRGHIRLGHQLEARDDFRAALDTLEQALTFDPFQEDVQRACLRLHYLAGDRAGAIRRYEDLRRLLDEELGVPPMDETRALYDAIITDTLPKGSGQPPTLSDQPAAGGAASLGEKSISHLPLPFIGRVDELQKLQTLTPAHKLILIEGEPGIGKTRLLREFIHTWRPAPDNNMLGLPFKLIGQARELEHTLSYQPMIEALRHVLADPNWPRLWAELDLSPVWRVEMAQLLPELSVPMPDPKIRAANEARLWEGVHQFLRAIARRQPVVLTLDDLHWADASTLGLLGYLVRQVGQVTAPIFFLAATRPAAAASHLAILQDALRREGFLEIVPLARLTAADITALARQLSPHYTYPLGNWLNRGSEGHPFFLAELVSYARQNNLLQPDGVVNLPALPATPTIPDTVYSFIRTRLARLSQVARRLLDSAVAAGHEFQFQVVARVAGLSDDRALEALDELQKSRCR